MRTFSFFPSYANNEGGLFYNDIILKPITTFLHHEKKPE